MDLVGANFHFSRQAASADDNIDSGEKRGRGGEKRGRGGGHEIIL